jgi:hypothetical protein
MFDAMPVNSMMSTCRAQVICLLQTFSRSISLPASDGPLVDDTNQYQLVDEGKPTRQNQSTQNLLKCLVNLNRSLSADILETISPDKSALSNPDSVSLVKNFCSACCLRK